MDSSKKLILKLVVDKEKKKVVFAEADKDFVDILFSFLTMPIGTIVRLLDKKTSLGCLDKLYESVEKLDEKYFQTEACKMLLLRPLCASWEKVVDLVLKIDDFNPFKYYVCRKPICCIHSFQFFSSVQYSRCGCGEIMDFEKEWAEENLKGSNENGVFVKGIRSFIITDDLQVMPATTANILNLLEKLGIKDGGSLENMTIKVGVEELMNLLKRSLCSKSPLSGIYFQEPDIFDNANFGPNTITLPKLEEDLAEECKRLNVKFLLCKLSNKVVYAESGAGEGLVDLLFSILTFPLGSIVKLLNKNTYIGCVDNLYKSVENLSSDCLISDDFKSMLLAPKLAAYFGCSDSLLPNDEMDGGSGTVEGCSTCFMGKKGTVGAGKCEHGVKHVLLKEMNPKRPASKEVGGGYAKEVIKSMITDDLQVTPFSALASIEATKKLGVSFTSLEEREISIGKTEALNLLKSCLTSQSSLSNVFLPKMQLKRKRKRKRKRNI